MRFRAEHRAVPMAVVAGLFDDTFLDAISTKGTLLLLAALNSRATSHSRLDRMHLPRRSLRA